MKVLKNKSLAAVAGGAIPEPAADQDPYNDDTALLRAAFHAAAEEVHDVFERRNVEPRDFFENRTYRGYRAGVKLGHICAIL